MIWVLELIARTILSKNIVLAIISIEKLGIKYLANGVFAKATKNRLLSAIMKNINIKKVSLSGIFFKSRSFKNRIVTSKKAMFENNPRAINENKKIAELNFIHLN